MKPEDTERVLQEMLADHHDRMVEFDPENEVDFSYAVPDLARFRINAFRQRGSVSIVARVIARSPDDRGVRTADSDRRPSPTRSAA